MLSSLIQSPPTQNDADSIKNVGLETFVADVIESSKQRLIVVAFGSGRSVLSKQSESVLEKLVRSTKGAVHLAKVDIDRNMEIAQQMGVQSVPATFAFSQGRPVDGFQGALPESQVKTWLDRVLKATGAAPQEGDGLGTALQQAAEFLAAKDIATAHSIYTDILDMVPTHAPAYAGLIRCLLASGDVTQARLMLDQAPAEMAKDKVLDPARTALELAEQAGQGGSVAELQAKLEQNPADCQLRFDLAMAYYAVDQKQEAVNQLLEIVRRNRSWNEDAARKQLVKFFEAFGHTDPLTLSARKRLSSLLFA